MLGKGIDMKRVSLLITLLILIIAVIQFMFLTPAGIRLGYKLNGGGQSNNDGSNRADELLRDYEEQLSTFIKYKDSDNLTARQWADKAKQKANEIAMEYNNIFNENLLEEIKD